MKIAVLLQGEPRFSEEFDWFIWNLSGADSVDYFCYLWKTSTESARVQGNNGNRLVAERWQDVDTNWVKKKFKNNLPEHHKLVSLVLDNQYSVNKDLLTENIAVETVQPNVWKMWYSLTNVNQNRLSYEKANNFEYDLVIRTRPDLALMDTLDLNKLKERFAKQDNLLLIPNNTRCGYGVFISDMFAVSLGKNITTYCNLYHEALEHHARGVKFHPETMLAKHLTHHGIIYMPGGFNVECRYLGTWRDIITGESWSESARSQIKNWNNKIYESKFGRWE